MYCMLMLCHTVIMIYCCIIFEAGGKVICFQCQKKRRKQKGWMDKNEMDTDRRQTGNGSEKQELKERVLTP